MLCDAMLYNAMLGNVMSYAVMWCRDMVQRHKITIFYTAPTAIRACTFELSEHWCLSSLVSLIAYLVPFQATVFLSPVLPSDHHLHITANITIHHTTQHITSACIKSHPITFHHITSHSHATHHVSHHIMSNIGLWKHRTSASDWVSHIINSRI